MKNILASLFHQRLQTMKKAPLNYTNNIHTISFSK